MPIREHTALVALRGGLIGLLACGLATMIYLAGHPADHPTGPAMMALPAGLGGGVLLARLLHLPRPWAVGVAGLVLSVAGGITAFVVIYRMLDMAEPMRAHPAWPLGVLLAVVATCYAWAAVLAEPPEPARHRYR